MRKKYIYSICGAAVCVSVLIFIVACGGGGGGSDTSPLTPSASTATTPALTVPEAEGAQGAINEVINALGTGDITTIEENFDPESWSAVYETAFSSSSLDRSALAQSLANAELVFQTEEYALYRVSKTVNGTVVAFEVHLIKVNGQWKIQSL